MKKVRLQQSGRPSSRNALKHGFAARRWVRDDRPRITMLTHILSEEKSTDEVNEAAELAAAARSYLEQVIAARDKLLNAILNLSLIPADQEASVNSLEKLEDYARQLSRLERYERQATIRWERALADLEAARLMASRNT